MTNDDNTQQPPSPVALCRPKPWKMVDSAGFGPFLGDANGVCILPPKSGCHDDIKHIQECVNQHEGLVARVALLESALAAAMHNTVGLSLWSQEDREAVERLGNS